MRETDAILQAILFQTRISKSIDEVKEFVMSMCSKENLDAVEVLIQAKHDREKKQGG